MTEFLIGYGTLLLRGSLAHSIGTDAAQAKDRIPVMVHDYRRLFNLRPEHYMAITSNKFGVAGIENGALNVEPASGHNFNALAFPTTMEELKALDHRERYYKRVVVPMVRFGTDAPVGSGHVYLAEPDSQWVGGDRSKLMPLWRDVVWARTGAYQWADDFGSHYDRTTYLADGETLVSEEYRELLLDTSDVDIPT